MRWCIFVCLLAGSLLAQDSVPSFEIASVKAAGPDDDSDIVITSGGRVRVTGFTLADLIQQAPYSILSGHGRTEMDSR